MSVFSNNLKRLRQAKKLTQEEAARFLGVSSQSISRWECAATLPDVTMLPEIARLYCVTIDDLYRETSNAYDNYAQRLAGVFEATQNPEDFIRADMEFQKLLRSGSFTGEDLRLYGILNQYMMQLCMEKAEQLFDRVLDMGKETDPQTYWSVRRQKGYFLWQAGRNREVMDQLLPKVKAGQGELQEWICLIQAYQLERRYEEALDIAKRASEIFPEDASLHTYTGDLLKSLGQYQDALAHWRRALALQPEWLDSAWSMAACHEELENYEQAAEVWEDIARQLQSRGFGPEVDYPKRQAERCRKRTGK